MIVQVDVLHEARSNGLGRVVIVQINIFVLQAAPELIGEDVVQISLNFYILRIPFSGLHPILVSLPYPFYHPTISHMHAPNCDITHSMDFR